MTEVVEEVEIDNSNNPWAVNLEEFYLWCCPECNFKTKTRDLLVHHGLMQHIKVCNIVIGGPTIIRHLNREFYDHFRVDDIVFTGILGKLEIV